jgi:hypothetical protein
MEEIHFRSYINLSLMAHDKIPAFGKLRQEDLSALASLMEVRYIASFRSGRLCSETLCQKSKD